MISVVVPVYNGERTIETCLKSLLDQTIPASDYEIVVVDDGSIDRTKELVSRLPATSSFSPTPIARPVPTGSS